MNNLEKSNCRNDSIPTYSTSQEFIDIIDTLSAAQRKIVDYFLNLGNYYEHIFSNQTTVGEYAGIGRQRTNVLIKILCDLGILSKLYRPNNTCLYSINPHFYDPYIRTRLSSVFTAFRWLPMIFLFAFQSVLPVDDATRNIPVNKIYLNRDGYKLSNVYKLTDSKSSFNHRERRSWFNVYGSNERTEFILYLTPILGLTRVGQCKLAPFPVEALRYATDHLAQSKAEIRNVWGWYISMCREWCRANDIRPDWKTESVLMEKYKLRSEDPAVRGKYDPKKLAKAQSHATGEYEQSFTLPVFEQGPNKQYSGKPKRGEVARPQTIWIRNDVPRGATPMLEVRLAIARKNGDEEMVTRLDKKADFSQPSVFNQAYHFAKMIPDKNKEELLSFCEENPEKCNPAVMKSLEEFKTKKLLPTPILDTLAADPVAVIEPEDYDTEVVSSYDSESDATPYIWEALESQIPFT